MENNKIHEESSPLLGKETNNINDKSSEAMNDVSKFPVVENGWTADGLPLHGSVVREPMARAQWDSGLCSCLCRHDEFCSSDLEVCLLGSVAPFVLYGSNVERLGSAPGTFVNRCSSYTGLYLIGNSFFGFRDREVSSNLMENNKIHEESSPLLGKETNNINDKSSKAMNDVSKFPVEENGWTADGLSLHGSVVGEPMARAQWDSGLCSCLGRHDEFCSRNLEVCLLGSVAPCVLYGSNVERLGSAPGTFVNHCSSYTGLYLIGNSFFGWNCLAPWFTYPSRTAIRRLFNLEDGDRFDGFMGGDDSSDPEGHEYDYPSADSDEQQIEAENKSSNGDDDDDGGEDDDDGGEDDGDDDDDVGDDGDDGDDEEEGEEIEKMVSVVSVNDQDMSSFIRNINIKQYDQLLLLEAELNSIVLKDIEDRVVVYETLIDSASNKFEPFTTEGLSWDEIVEKVDRICLREKNDYPTAKKPRYISPDSESD